MKHLIAITIVVLSSATSACSTKDDSMTGEQRIQEVAAAARADIDALAAQIGTDPEITQDDIGDCTPGNSNSGQSLSYGVHVTVEDPQTAVDPLRGEISDQLAADDWAVTPDSTGSPNTGETVLFQKYATTMGASIFMEKQYASIGGSGGCAPK